MCAHVSVKRSPRIIDENRPKRKNQLTRYFVTEPEPKKKRKKKEKKVHGEKTANGENIRRSSSEPESRAEQSGPLFTKELRKKVPPRK